MTNKTKNGLRGRRAALIVISLLGCGCASNAGTVVSSRDHAPVEHHKAANDAVWYDEYGGANAEVYKDLNGKTYWVKNGWDLPIGNYIHPKGYYQDVYYNAAGYKVLDVYYEGGQHVITTSGGHGESTGWLRQGVAAGAAYVPNRVFDEFKERWYRTYAADNEFRKLIDICKAIADTSRYDWDHWYKGLPHDVNRGFICNDYAVLVKRTLLAAGYRDVTFVSSNKANHAWNEVVLPDGRKVYVDVTWFDYDFDSDNRTWKEQEYSIENIVFERDRTIFDHGFSGKRMAHYAYGDTVYE